MPDLSSQCPDAVPLYPPACEVGDGLPIFAEEESEAQ
jgi:hypothetical protein